MPPNPRWSSGMSSRTKLASVGAVLAFSRTKLASVGAVLAFPRTKLASVGAVLASSRTKLASVGAVLAMVATALVAITVTAGPARAAGTGTGYLRTNGNRIVDSTGATIRLTGINWFG